MIGLVRGWETQYTPDSTGGLRLSKARSYREVEEEDGIGDKREGEIRISMPASVELGPVNGSPFPVDVGIALDDEPKVVATGMMPGERREVRQEIRVEDSGITTAHLFSAYRGNPKQGVIGRPFGMRCQKDLTLGR